MNSSRFFRINGFALLLAMVTMAMVTVQAQTSQDDMDKAFEEYDKQEGVENEGSDLLWGAPVEAGEDEAAAEEEAAKSSAEELKKVLKDNTKPSKGAIDQAKPTKAEADDKVATAEFKVEGVCGMCKERIENAALIKGVKFAEWNLETSILKVIYRSDKTDLNAIHTSLADAGHRTEEQKANEEAYKRLPGCCAYDDGVKKH